jgi:hypothetical protein
MEEGWRFWVEHNGRIRDLLVGGHHQNEESARRAVQTDDPTITDLNFVSKARVPWSLIRLFGLAGGGVREWNFLLAPITPTGPGGVEAGGDADVRKLRRRA